jgi:hypothetical protein
LIRTRTDFGALNTKKYSSVVRSKQRVACVAAVRGESREERYINIVMSPSFSKDEYNIVQYNIQCIPLQFRQMVNVVRFFIHTLVLKWMFLTEDLISRCTRGPL